MSKFIVSIDTELHWGFRFATSQSLIEKRNMLYKNQNKVINCIESLLNLLNKYDVPSTWAILGYLFRDNYEEIVEKIVSSSVEHEIGYHSFSHVRFSECNAETAEYEIKKSVEIGKDLGIKFNSFVFPENKIGHVDVLKKYGFKIYRGPNLAGKSINKNLPLRTVNFALSKFLAPTVEAQYVNGIWEIPTSILFHDPMFSHTLVPRVKLGIQKAIMEKKSIHIFLHPEDIFFEPDILNKMEILLKSVRSLNNEKIEICTMGNLIN